MTKNKNFDIIIIENESEEREMAEYIILMILLAILSIGAIVVTITDYIEKINHKRLESKRNFLRTHKGYGLDSKGKIIKL